ncbi:MAG: M20/M25/M40 family metallo-hydrolase [Chloroflexi bacterium]|nr:M20/M25/M40 family metallo-hydrolase [Chloroflexota bacterium]
MTTTHDQLPADAAQFVLDTFLALVRIDSLSGDEGAVAERLRGYLKDAGCQVWSDPAGNLLARRAGQGAGSTLPPLLLSAHMDTVEPGHGIQPRIVDGVVRSDGTTILGADDKAGVAAILTALRQTNGKGSSCCPVEVAFSVQEEVGLIGAKHLDLTQLASKTAIVMDSAGPVGSIVARAPSQDTMTIEITGQASHAGVAPEQGVSAVVVAARAIAGMRLGRIDPETTANIGVIRGGMATNIIPAHVTMRGEARSLDEGRLKAQTAHMRECFDTAAHELGAKVDFWVERSYASINLSPDSAVVRRVSRAMAAIGVEASLISTGGGSDANIFMGAGIETANLGFGMMSPHSVDEHIAVADLRQAALILTAILSDPQG